MSKPIHDALTALTLGERAIIQGTSVLRRSLFGFQIGAAPSLCDAAEAAARLAATVKRAPAVRVELCFRCAGDGLGRRDRGVCPVCHGRGIHVVEPPAGWAGASPAQLGAAAKQAAAALRSTARPRARESLAALLAEVGGLPAPRAA